MELRPYQKKVVDAIGDENSIVTMPTGSGKTFVAAEFVLRGLKSRNSEHKEAISTNNENEIKCSSALFLVPTCDLVTQQTRALKEWVGTFVVADYFGGKSVPAIKFDVLVSTPQAFLVGTVQTSTFRVQYDTGNQNSRSCFYSSPDFAANRT
jgi:superfamily II DNA or RNA helicase